MRACIYVCVRVCLGLRICGARSRQGCMGKGPAVAQEPSLLGLPALPEVHLPWCLEA